jgi:arylsulfatase A-like enzyme
MHPNRFVRLNKGSILLFILLALMVMIQPAGGATDAPNIILIYLDDLDASPEVLATMPNLQQLLVQQGTSFANALVAMPSCCPSRASLLTGQYVHNHGIIGNTYPYGGFQKFYETGQEQQTIATHLQSAGYRTMFVGKYLNGYPNGASQTYVPPGWSEWYAYLGGGGLYFHYTLNENGQLVRYIERPEDYSTDVYTRKVVDFIQRNSQSQSVEPFFVLVAPFAPHLPAYPAPRHAVLFPKLRAPRSPAFNETDVSDKPNWVRKQPPLSSDEIKTIDQIYRNRLRSLQAADEMIAQIVATLEEVGQLEKTYLIFSSDNGFHLGEHRLLLGKGTPYEEAIRVPLIVRGPGVPPGETRDQVVTNVDLASTFADWARQPFNESATDGRSLSPLLITQTITVTWRTAVLFENPPRTAPAPGVNIQAPDHRNEDDDYDARYLVEVAAAGRSAEPRQVAGQAAALIDAVDGVANLGLHTGALKYVEYKTGERELYDLTQDPYELTNLVASTPAEQLVELATWLAILKSCAGASCREADAFTPGQVPTPTPTPTPIPCADTPGNLLRNSGFEEGVIGWQFFTTGEASLMTTTSAYACQLAAQIEVTSPAANLQLYQASFLLKPNTIYRLHLAGWSSTGHDLTLYVQQHSGDTDFGLRDHVIDLTPSWQTYTVEFTTKRITTPTTDTRLRLWLAPYAKAGDLYRFDAIVLEELATSTGQPAEGNQLFLPVVQGE